MSEAACTEYSLWLGISGEAERRLTTLIGEFSRRFNSPQFKPHITLLGRIRAGHEEIIGSADRLSRTTASFEAELDGIGEAEAFFRCVFIKVKLHPPLIELYRQAIGFSGKDGYTDNYMPHISLVYGNLGPAERQAVITEVQRRAGPSDSRIPVSRIQVVQMDPGNQPEQWKIVAQRLLRSASEKAHAQA